MEIMSKAEVERMGRIYPGSPDRFLLPSNRRTARLIQTVLALYGRVEAAERERDNANGAFASLAEENRNRALPLSCGEGCDGCPPPKDCPLGPVGLLTDCVIDREAAVIKAGKKWCQKQNGMNGDCWDDYRCPHHGRCPWTSTDALAPKPEKTCGEGEDGTTRH